VERVGAREEEKIVVPYFLSLLHDMNIWCVSSFITFLLVDYIFEEEKDEYSPCVAFSDEEK